MHRVRQAIELRERESLSPFAALAADSRGRPEPIEPDPVRTCFQRDRDRVLHSKPFRRLKHKTQVFVAPAGDHYRTRLTHTLEVAQVARTLGRALRLNEDLIEAIALAHDLGHPPFGHAGEEALSDEIARRHHAWGDPSLPDRFRHHEQSLRVVDVLARLNLSHEVRDGIAGHSKGDRDLSDADGQPVSTLEAAVVRVSDRLAYLHHDLDDAVRSGIVTTIPAPFAALGEHRGQRLGTMVLDVIENSLDRPEIRLSPSMLAILNDLKDWLYANVYRRYPELDPDIAKAQRAIRDLFGHYLEPANLPSGYSGPQGAIDYVSGMTDRFAIEAFRRLVLPEGLGESIRSIL